MGENQDLICSNHRLVSDVFRHDIVFAFQIIWRECLYHADPRTLLLGNLLSCSLVWVIPSLGKWFMLRSTVILKKIETSLVIYLYIHRAYSNLVACTSTVSLVGVAVFHVVGTRACQPSKTRVSDYHQNIGISHQCSQYSVVIKAVDIKTVPEDVSNFPSQVDLSAKRC